MALVNRDDPWSVARYATGVSGAVNAARSLYRAYKKARRYVRSGNPRSVSRFEVNLNKGKRSAPSQMSGPVKRMRIYDQGGYSQFRRFKYKTGKRTTYKRWQSKLIKAITTKQRMRFSGVRDLSDGQGYYPMYHFGATTGTDTGLVIYPVFCFNLCSAINGPSSAIPFYRLLGNTVSNAMSWQQMPAQNRAPGGAVFETWQMENIDTDATNTIVGRKSLLDWVRARFTIWGKKAAPTEFTIQMVYFPDDQFCPEYGLLQGNGIGAPMETDAAEYWKSVAKPLVTNPCDSFQRYANKRPKIVKEWRVKIDPTSTTEGDQDPHCKFVDIFHRFGRVIDYSNSRADRQEPVSDINTAGAWAQTQYGYTGYPKRLESSCYLVIKALTPDYITGAAPVTNLDIHNTFDMNIQACHSTVQPNVS